MKFGLLGTGYWAREVHAPALSAHPGVEFVGVWGRVPAKAAELARDFDVIAYEHVDALLAEVDAVATALPPDVAATLALRAARAGKHLLLDKPIALTEQAAESIVAEVSSRDLSSIVFFTSRFQPTTIEALAEVTATGGWHGGRAVMYGSIYTPGNPYGNSAWRQEHGGLWDIGPHALSLLVPMLGAVEAVTAMQGPRQTTHVTLRHDGGAVSTMALTLDAPPSAGRFEVKLHGESGWRVLPGFDGDAVGSLSTAITQLLATGTGPVDVRFGRDVVAILAAAQESARSGGAIALV